MYVWSDNTKKHYVVHDGDEVVTYTTGLDLEMFYQDQHDSQGKYTAVESVLKNTTRQRYGVDYQGLFITTMGGELNVLTTPTQDVSIGVYEGVLETVQQINWDSKSKTLSEDECQEFMQEVYKHIPDEYEEFTKQALANLNYKNDLGLVYDLLEVINTWVDGDGFKGELAYTDKGLHINFGLDHPIVIHIGGYGVFSTQVDQTFMTWFSEDDTMYTKVKSIFGVFLDYYKWVNPLELSYQTNRVLGDDKIKVTLKDPRIIAYQRDIQEDFNVIRKECREINHLDLVFSHTTRSIYVNLTFFDNIPPMRLSVRDHDNCHEEGIHIIRVNTLRANNIKGKVMELLTNYIKQHKGRCYEQVIIA